MKKLLPLILTISFTANFAFGQTSQWIDFENPYSTYLWIDTINNPNNIWQVGSPQKTVFSSAYSQTHSFLSDTINSYPVNDTSSFIIRHKIMTIGGYCGTYFWGNYEVNSDTLNDYGKIEFTMDNGQTWIDISDSTYFFVDFNTIIPTLSGNSNGWKYFSFFLNINSIVNNGDTVLFRFTFISDNIQTNKDGLMYDDIFIDDMQEGVHENNASNLAILVYPNPATDNITIKTPEKATIEILNIQGQIIKTINTAEKQTTIDISNLSGGVYIIKAKTEKGVAVRKFIKQ